MEILPVTIRCEPPVLTHGRPWYRMPSQKVRYVISFHPPRPPAAFARIEGLPPSLAARRATRGMETWFKRQLNAPQVMHTTMSVSDREADPPGVNRAQR
jgi:hypothetical protein